MEGQQVNNQILFTVNVLGPWGEAHGINFELKLRPEG